MARSSWIHPPLAPGEHYCSVPPSLSRICEVQWQRNIHSHTLSHSHTQAHIHTAGRLFIHVSILTFLKLYVSLCYLALCVFPVPYYCLVSVPLWPLPHSQWFKPSPSRACCDCASVVVFCSVFPALAAFLLKPETNKQTKILIKTLYFIFYLYIHLQIKLPALY